MIASVTRKALAGSLLVTASAIAMASPALAQQGQQPGQPVHQRLFASNPEVADAAIRGTRVNQASGVTQIRLANGGIASFVDSASYQVNGDGSVDLYSGSVTISGSGRGAVLVRLADKGQGQVDGADSAASFSVDEDGVSGHVLTGTAQIALGGGSFRRFEGGQLWRGNGNSARRVVANGDQAVPGAGGTAAEPPAVLAMAAGGPQAAALNGLPVVLGDALAGAGASGDVLAAARRIDLALANPALETFPAGDFQLLVAYAAGLEGAYGGVPFNGARADIIRTYLQFLAGGGAQAEFVSSYAALSVQFLDLVRSGAAPSSFSGASLAQINSWLRYVDRTSGFAGLSSQNRLLVEAWLDFLAQGGNANRFAATYTDLTRAYFAFLRGGGQPAEFQQASQQVVGQYLAFLRDSGLDGQLNVADRALLALYLDQGGLAFASQYRAALEDYFTFLASGRLPSAYQAADPATLSSWLEALQTTGLFDTVLDDRAEFFAAYLAHLQAGGDADSFARLPANIFATYAVQLQDWYDFQAAGNLPSAYAGDPAQLRAWLEALADAGALERFLGSQAGFYADYLAWLQEGGTLDGFAGLNANIFASYASQLATYYDYLLQGGVPSSYAALSQQQIADYVAALQAAGATQTFLDQLADFYSGYFAFLQTGGNPDTWTGLPVLNLPTFADALNAYYAFLAGGGLPSAYGAQELEVLGRYLQALVDSGQAASLLGGNLDLLDAYFAHLSGGGAADQFAGLPVYADYTAALSAYFAFLQGGGLPGDYTALSQAQVQAYLAALGSAGGLGQFFGSDLASFYSAYFAYLQAGGNPATFAGLPLYEGYASALQAYFSFLQGGGLPDDYTALTQAQIADYLAALQAAGGFELQLGTLASFYSAYFAHLSGGGDPATFAGLPLYAGYVEALNAYFAFLQGGGLPGDYTALTPAQIEAYLAALSGVQGGLGSFAGLNDFFAGYFAHLSAGGDPAEFAGLPVYAQYLDALQAFYAHLAAGGAPSAYTALTMEQIQAYLALLAGLGLLADSFDAQILAFWTDYLAFLTGGGLPDDFPSFPTGTPFQMAAGHAWISDPNNVGIGAITGAEVAADGTIGTISYASGASRTIMNEAAYTVMESGRLGEDVAWTRYLREPMAFAPNWQTHVLTGVVPTNLPTTGKVDYLLVGGTAPSDHRGTHGTTGSFTGAMSVNYGSPPRVGFEMDVYMDSRGWRASTLGGVASPQRGGFQLNPATGRFEGTAETTSLLGAACADFCSTYVRGGLFGEGGESAGLVYNIADNDTQITGISIFATTGTAVPMIGTRPDVPGGGGGGGTLTGYTGGFDPLTAKINFITTLTIGSGSQLPGSETGFDALAYTLDTNGGLTSYTRTGGTRRTSGSTTITDIYGNENVVIGRWTDGRNTGGNPFTLTENQGFHYMLARPVADDFALPASGTIHYDLLAATSPTIVDGSLAPGAFSGEMALLLGSAPKVAMEASITMPGSDGGLVLDYATTGGLANPELSQSGFQLNPNLTFAFTVPGASSNGCTPDTCSFSARGSFGGSVENLGFTYTAEHAGGSAKTVIGSAIFGAAETQPGEGDIGVAGFTGSRGGQQLYLGRNGSGFSNSVPGTAELVNGQLVELNGGSYGSFRIGTAQVAEAGDLGAVSWARWSNGAASEVNGPFSQPTALGENGGWQVLAGTPATDLPASGTVDYTLVAATALASLTGPEAGTVTGDLAVQFGAAPTVGFDFQMNLGGMGWAVATPGGAADPSGGVALGNRASGPLFVSEFSAAAGNVVASGGACAAGCTIQVEGRLFGEGAAYAGVGLGVVDGATKASALAIFQAEGAAPAPNPLAVAAQGTIQPASAEPLGWNRFEGAAGPAGAPLQPGIPQAGLSIADAEALLGGMISFAKPAQ